MRVYKKTYFLFIGLILLVLIFFNVSYAIYDSTHEELGVVKINLTTLEPLLESPSFNDEKEITVEANTTKEVTITLTNIYEIDIKANLYYSSTTNTTEQEVFYRGVATPPKEGVLVPKYGEEGHTITYTVTIENTSSTNQTYSFYSKGGFTYNELDFSTDPIYKIITEAPNFMLSGPEFNSVFIENYSWKYSFTTIEFEEGINPNYTTFENNFDLSEKQDSSIIGYIDGEVLRIQSNGKIYANPDSSNLFSVFRVNTINFNNNLDTSSVTNMGYMFLYSTVTSLDLTSFDTSSVTDMSVMFADMAATSLDLTSFDTSSVTNMSSMFNSSKATSLDLSSFDTSSVTNMRYMFSYSAAASLDLTSFDTSSVTTMGYMFSSSAATSLDLTSFDTSSVTNMRDMFNSSKATSLDLTSFDTSSVTDMRYMFSRSAATTVYARTTADKTKFDASSEKPAGLTVIVGTP